MIIPTFQAAQFVGEDGFLTSQMRSYNDELNNVLRNGLSDNGWTIPVISPENLLKLETLPEVKDRPINGTIWLVSSTPALPAPQYNELVIKMDDGTGTGTSALYKLTKAAYP